MPFLNQLTFPQLMWLVPILFAIHNLEEAPLMKAWSEKSPLPFHTTIKTAPFSIAVTFLTILAFVVTGWGVNSPPQSLGVYLVVTLQAVILLNAFLPHVAVTIRYRSYNPGVINGRIPQHPLLHLLLLPCPDRRIHHHTRHTHCAGDCAYRDGCLYRHLFEIG